MVVVVQRDDYRSPMFEKHRAARLTSDFQLFQESSAQRSKVVIVSHHIRAVPPFVLIQ